VRATRPGRSGARARRRARSRGATLAHARPAAGRQCRLCPFRGARSGRRSPTLGRHFRVTSPSVARPPRISSSRGADVSRLRTRPQAPVPLLHTD
jgi:hypothetical protein